jgi:hypothetical protein
MTSLSHFATLSIRHVVAESKQLMLFKEIFGLFGRHTKEVNSLYGKHQELLNFETGGTYSDL